MTSPQNTPQIPEETTGEKAHRAAKAVAGAGAGLIAFAHSTLGGAIAAGGMQALIEFFLKDPWERRAQQWTNEVGDVLSQLEERLDAITPDELLERLRQDADFIATLQQATTYAIRSHQDEKLKALRNALLNSALPGAPAADLQATYLRLIDDLSPTHLRILWVAHDPYSAMLKSHGLEALSRRAKKLSFSQIVEAGLPDLADQVRTWHVFAAHLENEGLLQSLNEPPDRPFYEAFLPFTTELGRGFLDYIQPHREDPRAAAALRQGAPALEKLQRELDARGRSQRFLVNPIRRLPPQRGDEPVLDAIAIHFPRESARRPVSNGNPPSLVEMRLSLTGPSVAEVFSDARSGQPRGVVPLEFAVDNGFGFQGKTFAEPSRTADAIIQFIEEIFPNHAYWR